MGIPDDIASLTTQLTALTVRVAALEKAAAGPVSGVSGASLVATLKGLPPNERKAFWKDMRDGT